MSEIKSSPARFNADDLQVSQNFATSADGTRIPYFLVSHRDSAGPGPTLLGGYGRVLYYENTEGGHGGVSNNAQAAYHDALMYEFLHSTLSP